MIESEFNLGLRKLVERYGIEVSDDPELFEKLVYSSPDNHYGVYYSRDNGWTLEDVGSDFFARNGIGFDDSLSIADWARKQGEDFLFFVVDFD